MANTESSRLDSRPGWWRTAAIALMACVLLLSGGCGQPPGQPGPVTLPQSADIIAVEVNITELAAHHAGLLSPELLRLSLAVDEFLAQPAPESRQALQQAWLSAHKAFSHTLPLARIHVADNRLFDIDAWPIEPGFLDSLPQYPDSGIISDFTLIISRETLIRQHGFTDPSEASLGFHPIEYYAFARPIEDFVPGQSESIEANLIERRRQLLAIVAGDLANSVGALINVMTNTPVTSDSAPSVQRLGDIIAGSRRTALRGFQQANLIVDSDQGHCEYSETSFENLRYETQTLRTIFAGDSMLMSILTALDANTTGNLDNTLDQAISVLTDSQPTEAERAKLPLMFSAISHQLEEFELVLTVQEDPR